MVKNKSVKKSINKKSTVKSSKKSVVQDKPHEKPSRTLANVTEDYKTELLEANNQEARYDKLFEEKLAQQYREFRNLKEHHVQSKKFLRVIIILIVIILIALLLLSYR